MIVCVTQCFVFFYSVAAWWQIKMFNTPFFLCFSSCTVYFFLNYSIFISKCLNSWSLSEANNLSLYLKHGKVVNSLSLFTVHFSSKKNHYTFSLVTDRCELVVSQAVGLSWHEQLYNLFPCVSLRQRNIQSLDKPASGSLINLLRPTRLPKSK